ncbi:MAG: AIM24 family protein [Candidatus Bathyarchaeales archaeon]
MRAKCFISWIEKKRGVAGEISIRYAKNLFLLNLAFSLSLPHAFTEYFVFTVALATNVFKVTKFSGLKETILDGEGLVVNIEGPGEVYIQTKNLGEFVEWLWTLLEPRVRAKAR